MDLSTVQKFIKRKGKQKRKRRGTILTSEEVPLLEGDHSTRVDLEKMMEKTDSRERRPAFGALPDSAAGYSLILSPSIPIDQRGWEEVVSSHISKESRDGRVMIRVLCYGFDLHRAPIDSSVSARGALKTK
ncbi:hypothetical protein AVEN_107854-1 [Araneus ventricosus]|uniref:Uncharacterized protein n=1 Tax=Araneus ventricosus TaxID=182803 RepID=A0A4Y2IVZ5_ARAVE|nr:hypothetical protein AVEN_107854-1 [Araneus ventricosus]